MSSDEESGEGRGIGVPLEDIMEVELAKGALALGIVTLTLTADPGSPVTVTGTRVTHVGAADTDGVTDGVVELGYNTLPEEDAIGEPVPTEMGAPIPVPGRTAEVSTASEEVQEVVLDQMALSEIEMGRPVPAETEGPVPMGVGMTTTKVTLVEVTAVDVVLRAAVALLSALGADEMAVPVIMVGLMAGYVQLPPQGSE